MELIRPFMGLEGMKKAAAIPVMTGFGANDSPVKDMIQSILEGQIY